VSRLPFAAFLFICAAAAQPQGMLMRTPYRGMPSVNVPPDPNEPVTGVIESLTAQADRSKALAMMIRARKPQQFHTVRTPSFQLEATFTSTAGAGTLSDTWMSGRKWRWSGSVGNETAVRVGGEGLVYGSPNGGAIPPAVHVLRNAIFWAAAGVPDESASIRSSAVIWNGKPTTCMLFGPGRREPIEGPRSWEEEEYCVDDASGQLQVHSFAPGTYVNYSYSSAPFHGRTPASGITVYSGGKKVLDAQLTMTDPGSPDDSLFIPTEQMRSYGPVGTGMMPSRMLWMNPSASVSDAAAKPVIVHASVDGQGMVVAEELSIASDPSLAQTALDLVKGRSFPPNGNIREIYVEVSFVAQQ
jgi:hypothetical protein